MVEKTIRREAPNIHRVRDHGNSSRLCLRPERKPGVAPDCEDAREDATRNGGNYSTQSLAAKQRVTLPRLKFMENSK